MGICFHAVYRKQADPTISVPSPYDKETPNADWWWDHLAKQVPYLASIGVTSILLPPISKTNGGAYPGADGYGGFDFYDVGSKEQYFSRATRFGTREQLQRLIAIAAAYGIDTYIDFVPHQCSGGSYGEYRYLGAPGKVVGKMSARAQTASIVLSDPAHLEKLVNKHPERIEEYKTKYAKKGLTFTKEVENHVVFLEEIKQAYHTQLKAVSPTKLNGRFPKHKSCFRGDTRLGYVNQDPVMSPPDDFSFGDELCPINSVPKDYVAKGLIDVGDWTVRSLGIEGGRIDDTKGLAASFVKRWATSKSMKGKYWFGEYADGNPDSLHWAVWESGCDGVISTADFAFHYRIKDMCEGPDRWDMRQLTHIGYCARDPMKALTFVENQDSDTNGFGQIAFNKAAAYFALLTLMGNPSVFYRDWSKDRDCYGWGLQPHINNYMWINSVLISGDLIERYSDKNLSVYERQGGPKCLCAINNDPYNWRNVWVQTGFGANVNLHDYTGHADDVWTNQDGWAHIWIPPNVNGLGTVAYSRSGLDRAITPKGRAITQTFFGAEDLDIDPLINKQAMVVGQIWCKKGSKITLHLTTSNQKWGSGDEIHMTLRIGYKDDSTHTFDPKVKRATVVVNSPVEGWVFISLELHSDSVDTAAYELEVTYTATDI